MRNNLIIDTLLFVPGTLTQKLEVFFTCYDLNNDGSIQSDELACMLGHLPVPVLASLRLCTEARSRMAPVDGGLDTTSVVADIGLADTSTPPRTTRKEEAAAVTTTTTMLSPPATSATASAVATASAMFNNTPAATTTPATTTPAATTPATTTPRMGGGNIGVYGETVDIFLLEIVQRHHSRIVEEMVKVAFEYCDLNHDGRLSFAQFAVWVERNRDLMDWMSRTGGSSSSGGDGVERLSVDGGVDGTIITSSVSTGGRSKRSSSEQEQRRDSMGSNGSGGSVGGGSGGGGGMQHESRGSEGVVSTTTTEPFSGYLWKRGTRSNGEWTITHKKILSSLSDLIIEFT